MSHIFPDNYRVLDKQPNNKIVMGKHILDGIVSIPKDIGHPDLFPQLFIYAFDARVEPQTKFKIKMAITDYYDSVYLFDKEMYFDVRVEIDRKVTMHNHIKGGDYTIDFGILSEGEHSISLQAIDSLGRKSQRIFYDILVRTYDIPESLTYRATLSDLAANGITLGLTETSNVQLMKNNKIGLNKLMNDKKAAGFKKLFLPASGIYRVFHSKRDTYEASNPYVKMPTEFTLDLNGSNLKLHSYLDKDGLGPNIVVKFVNCYDSHIINGTLDGDWIERQVRKAEFSSYEGEGAGNISFYGNSKFCTLRNVTTKNVTGYNIGSSFYEPTVSSLSALENWMDNKSVNELNGELIDRPEYATFKMEDITKYLASGQIACNYWLGYGGIVGTQFEILLSFYDEKQAFIEQIQVMQHRMCKIPLRSKFMRVTIKATAKDSVRLSLHSHSTPKAIALLDCHWEKNRTCVAPAQFQHWMMKNCTFFESGSSITPCAIDLEDGWEQMQDFFMVDCDIQAQSGTADFIDNSGMNHHITGCDNWRVILRRGITSRVINNNTRSSLSDEVGWKSSLSRYYDNELNGFRFENLSAPPQVLKNKTMVAGYVDNAPQALYGGTYKMGAVKNTKCVGVTISKNEDGNHYMGENNLFYCCKFVGNVTYPIYTMHLNNEDYQKGVRNQWLECIFEAPTEMRNHNHFLAGLWSECTFLDTVEINPHPSATITIGDIQFNNCVFEKPVKYNNRPIQFNNCTFKQGVTCTGVSTAQFNNCVGV